ncbi:MAG: MBL fold metallo-hydrolase [bacterium]|nr:MBL fold metallo-hydrolase [bacterium]
MKIKYLAHSSFLFETREGIKIITDPYKSDGLGGKIKYNPITEKTDIVLISHEHMDHNYTDNIPGNPTIIKNLGVSTVNGITFNGILSYHDNVSGSQRGKNTIFVFKADGITFCHTGDLGHLITPELKNNIGKIDVLFIPIGGTYTITSEEAQKVVDTLGPMIVIPMHYKTSGTTLPISNLEEFTKGKLNIKQAGTVAEIKLPAKQEIWVFQPACLPL